MTDYSYHGSRNHLKIGWDGMGGDPGRKHIIYDDKYDILEIVSTHITNPASTQASLLSTLPDIHKLNRGYII